MRTVLIASFLAVAASASAHAEGDVTKGASVFKKCMVCHVADSATNKVGPSLKGIVGRKTATVPGFKYSKGMTEKGAAGQVWDEATLDAYLADPKKMVPGTKMVFPGLKKPDERADVIAFLKTKT